MKASASSPVVSFGTLWVILLASVALDGCKGCGSSGTTETPQLRLQPTAAVPNDGRPALAPPSAYQPPKPQRYVTAQGLRVWLFERRDLPLVAAAFATRYGVAQDPPGRPGLAYLTAQMLTRGAGDRDRAQTVATLADTGASLEAYAQADGSIVTVRVSKTHFDTAFAVFADAIARPHFDPAQWSEVSVRWQQELRLRDRDFATVSRVVSQAVIYGPDTPYGHPARGRLATASLISREHLKSFHEQTFRPDRGLLVVVGDLSRSELDSALAKN